MQHVSINPLFFPPACDRLLLSSNIPSRGGFMIAVARKDLLEALKWSRRYSPVAYLVLSMNGKWGTRKDNALNIVESFKRLWPETRAYLKTVATMSYKGGGRILASDLEINYPQKRFKNEIHNDFFLLLKEMSRYMDEAEDYEAMVHTARHRPNLPARPAHAARSQARQARIRSRRQAS